MADRVAARHDPTAERAVLAGLILAPELLDAVRLAPEDFADPRHATIYDALRALVAAGRPVDLGTVADALRAARRLDAVGWTYLAELTDEATTAAHAEEHARIVAREARARRVAAALHTALARLTDPGVATDDALAFAEARVAEAGRGREVAALAPLSAAVEAAFDVATGAASAGPPGVPTGFARLDGRLGGFRAGQLVVLAARPAMGKSALAAQAAIHAARATGQGVLYASLEMPRVEVGARLLAAEAAMDLTRLRGTLLTGEEFDALVAATNDLGMLPVSVLDGSAGDVRLADLRAAARRVQHAAGLALVVVDYLGLLKPERDRDAREREVAELSRGLKVMAGQLGCPVLLLAQLNRDCEKRADKRPMLSDLRESGAIEQDADVVLFLYRDEVYNPSSPDTGVAEVIVAKQRNGPPGTERVAWVGPRAMFADLEHDRATAPNVTRMHPKARRAPAPPAAAYDQTEDGDAE